MQQKAITMKHKHVSTNWIAETNHNNSKCRLYNSSNTFVAEVPRQIISRNGWKKLNQRRLFPQYVKHSHTGAIAKVIRSRAVELVIVNPGKSGLKKGKIVGAPVYYNKITFDKKTCWLPLKQNSNKALI
jgi:uncharacterized protein YjlB